MKNKEALDTLHDIKELMEKSTIPNVNLLKRKYLFNRYFESHIINYGRNSRL